MSCYKNCPPERYTTVRASNVPCLRPQSRLKTSTETVQYIKVRPPKRYKIIEGIRQITLNRRDKNVPVSPSPRRVSTYFTPRLRHLPRASTPAAAAHSGHTFGFHGRPRRRVNRRGKPVIERAILWSPTVDANVRNS